MSVEIWRPYLSGPAQQDFDDIVIWTVKQFGKSQAKTYADIIRAALLHLQQGPLAPGAKNRADLGPDLHTLNIAMRGRRGRHFLLYRPRADGIIEILRILHQSMDVERHLPSQA